MIRWPWLTSGVVLMAASLAACGSATRRASTSDARVQSGTCRGAHGPTRVVLASCLFLASDGEQFSCRLAGSGKVFKGRMPTIAQLKRTAGCKQLASLILTRARRRVLAAVDRTRSCLQAKGLKALGGLPPHPPGATTPDGEVALSKEGALVAFYTDAARAQRAEPSIARSVAGGHGQLQRRGAATILWTRVPSGSLRATVDGCAFG